MLYQVYTRNASTNEFIQVQMVLQHVLKTTLKTAIGHFPQSKPSVNDTGHEAPYARCHATSDRA